MSKTPSRDIHVARKATKTQSRDIHVARKATKRRRLRAATFMSREKRRIAVVTGTRAEYGLLQTLMRSLRERNNVELQVVVTGTHLLKRFGHTIEQIRADGWSIDAAVPMQAGRDDPLDQAVGLARGVEGLAKAFEKLGTDMVVVLGDRIEALAAALAATTTRRFLAHIHGGDVAEGDVDDVIRHAITKLSHLHFAATADAARRIVRMGERPECVLNVGAPGLDDLRKLVKPQNTKHKTQNTKHKPQTPDPRPQEERRALIVQHPRGLGAKGEERVMSQLLAAVADEGLGGTIIHPCSDPGYSGIVSAIRKFRSRTYRQPLVFSLQRSAVKAQTPYPKPHTPQSWPLHLSLPRERYLRELVRASVLVGNSSSGIIESALAGTPAVNVGPRQAGRLRCAKTVIDCGETYEQIRRAIRRALRMRPRRGVRTRYGDGRAGGRTAEKLATIPLTDRLRRKRIAY